VRRYDRSVLVEVLTLEGCPQAADAVELARRVVAETGVVADVRLVHVTREQADARRFLGSPSIRVDDRDVEPGADARREYAFSCRLYPTPAGLRPLPREEWLHAALAARDPDA
jgi:hypothetical protein